MKKKLSLLVLLGLLSLSSLSGCNRDNSSSSSSNVQTSSSSSSSFSSANSSSSTVSSSSSQAIDYSGSTIERAHVLISNADLIPSLYDVLNIKQDSKKEKKMRNNANNIDDYTTPKDEYYGLGSYTMPYSYLYNVLLEVQKYTRDACEYGANNVIQFNQWICSKDGERIKVEYDTKEDKVTLYYRFAQNRVIKYVSGTDHNGVPEVFVSYYRFNGTYSRYDSSEYASIYYSKNDRLVLTCKDYSIDTTNDSNSYYVMEVNLKTNAITKMEMVDNKMLKTNYSYNVMDSMIEFVDGDYLFQGNNSDDNIYKFDIFDKTGKREIEFENDVLGKKIEVFIPLYKLSGWNQITYNNETNIYSLTIGENTITNGIYTDYISLGTNVEWGTRLIPVGMDKEPAIRFILSDCNGVTFNQIASYLSSIGLQYKESNTSKIGELFDGYFDSFRLTKTLGLNGANDINKMHFLDVYNRYSYKELSVNEFKECFESLAIYPRNQKSTIEKYECVDATVSGTFNLTVGEDVSCSTSNLKISISDTTKLDPHTKYSAILCLDGRKGEIELAKASMIYSEGDNFSISINDGDLDILRVLEREDVFKVSMYICEVREDKYFKITDSISLGKDLVKDSILLKQETVEDYKRSDNILSFTKGEYLTIDDDGIYFNSRYSQNVN